MCVCVYICMYILTVDYSKFILHKFVRKANNNKVFHTKLTFH